MAARHRVTAASGFILHTIPYRETSLIIEVFSRDYGRLPMVAKGARRPRSGLRGVLMSFQSLELSWQGQGEVKTLTDASWQGVLPMLSGHALLCAYYLNELLLKLMPREDAHPVLYDLYASSIQSLTHSGPHEACLRYFELGLLRELGYALPLEYEADTKCAVQAETRYVYSVEHGPYRDLGEYGEAASMHGKTLLDLAANDFSDPRTLAESKQLLRRLTAHYLGGQSLNARRILMELQTLSL